MKIKKPFKKKITHLPRSIQDHIQHLEIMRRDFVANISHELRTPLTVIQGYLETLIQHKTDPTHQAIFEQMFHHSIRMSNIIEDLLTLSALEGEEYTIKEKKQIPISKMLKILLLEAQNISGKKNHKFTLKADPNLFLDGAENELKSLFSNIIVNAIKYTPAKGRITIQWYEENNTGIFRVIDTGIGISKKQIPRITERFYRVDKARSRESGGTGLGLAIVKHILLNHNGELAIESQLKKGSTFTCIFPSERITISHSR